MRVKWVVQVLAQVICGAATPVLKDVQIGLALILPEEKRECDGSAVYTPLLVCRSEVARLMTRPHYLVNKNHHTLP